MVAWSIKRLLHKKCHLSIVVQIPLGDEKRKNHVDSYCTYYIESCSSCPIGTVIWHYGVTMLSEILVDFYLYMLLIFITEQVELFKNYFSKLLLNIVCRRNSCYGLKIHLKPALFSIKPMTNKGASWAISNQKTTFLLTSNFIWLKNVFPCIAKKLLHIDRHI